MAMDFDEFWRILSECLKHTKKFKTLTQEKTFEATMTDHETVTVTPDSTSEKRDVKKNEFRQMWDIMKNDKREERYVSRDGRYRDFWNPAYVNALIDYKVGDQDMQ